jgi:Flp pilus assembly protein TadG
MRPKRKAMRAGRRAAVTLELIVALAILVVLLVAVFEYATLMVFQSTITHAATAGAREAGKGAQIGEVADVVSQIVGVNCIAVTGAPGSGTKVILEDGSPGCPTTAFGDPDFTACTVPTNPLNEDEVRVTVCVAIEATPFCNALGTFLCGFPGELGFSLSGCHFHASSVVKKECLWDCPR